MKDAGQKAVVMLEKEGSLHSSKLFKEAIVFAWVKKSDKTLRICGKTPEPVSATEPLWGNQTMCWSLREEEESHTKGKGEGSEGSH